MPFLDITPYKDSNISSDGRRIPGISNFFKAKLRLEPGDLQGRLKRMHRVLKKAWYLNEPEKTVEYLIDEEKKDQETEEQKKNFKPNPMKYLMTYEQLFSVDFVTDKDKFFIETPFTFTNWRIIEILQNLCQLPTQAAKTMITTTPLTADIAQTICLNILPEVETVMHRITSSYEFTAFFC